MFIPLFIGAYGDMAGCGRIGEWWGNLIMMVVFQLVQLATFPIYLGVLRRTAKAAARTLSRLGSSLSASGGAALSRLGTSLQRGGAPDEPAVPEASGELKKATSSELEAEP